MLDHTTLYPDGAESLDRLTAGGVTPQRADQQAGPFSQEILAGLGVGGHFFRVYGGNSFEQKKPDPTGVHVPARGVRRPQGTDADWSGTARWMCSRRATPGVAVCGVTYGFQPESLDERKFPISGGPHGSARRHGDRRAQHKRREQHRESQARHRSARRRSLLVHRLQAVLSASRKGSSSRRARTCAAAATGRLVKAGRDREKPMTRFDNARRLIDRFKGAELHARDRRARSSRRRAAGLGKKAALVRDTFPGSEAYEKTTSGLAGGRGRRM